MVAVKTDAAWYISLFRVDPFVGFPFYEPLAHSWNLK